jgi:RNA polymerase sigma-70 factor (ECF subfamily)
LLLFAVKHLVRLSGRLTALDEGNLRKPQRNQTGMAHVPKVAPIKPSSRFAVKDGEAGTPGVASGTSSGTSSGTASGSAPGTATGNAGTAKGGAHDRELVRRAQANDREAYEELVKRHQQRVFAVASGILRRHEDVEDIAQQVFIKAYFSLKRFDGRAAFSTWLYRITLNECWDLLRKKKVRPLLYESDLSEEQSQRIASAENADGAGPDILQRLETRQRVEMLLAGLEERDRLMLILKEVEGFSIEEIAEVLDLNANTVKVRLFRARRRVVKTAQEQDSKK